MSHPDLEAMTSGGCPGLEALGNLPGKSPLSLTAMKDGPEGAWIKNTFLKIRKVLESATGDQLPPHQVSGDREQPDPGMVKATGQGIYSQS